MLNIHISVHSTYTFFKEGTKSCLFNVHIYFNEYVKLCTFFQKMCTLNIFIYVYSTNTFFKEHKEY